MWTMRIGSNGRLYRGVVRLDGLWDGRRVGA